MASADSKRLPPGLTREQRQFLAWLHRFSNPMPSSHFHHLPPLEVPTRPKVISDEAIVKRLLNRGQGAIRKHAVRKRPGVLVVDERLREPIHVARALAGFLPEAKDAAKGGAHSHLPWISTGRRVRVGAKPVTPSTSHRSAVSTVLIHGGNVTVPSPREGSASPYVV
jgi:hypothetical protein